MHKFWLILGKDLLLESRSKDMWVSMMGFVFMVIFLFAFAVGATETNLQGVFPGIIWLAFLFAGMLSMGRSFGREVAEDTLSGLILAPGERLPIFVAKVTVAFLFMASTEVLASPVFFALFNEPWHGHYGLFGLILGLGALGFVGVGTLLSAMSSHLRSGEVVMPLVLMPLEVPVIITAVQATSAILKAPMADPWPWIHGLMAYDVIFLALPLVMYEYLWEVS